MCNKSLRQYGCIFLFKKSKWSRCFFSSVASFLCSFCVKPNAGDLLMSHAQLRRLPGVAEKGGSGPSSSMNILAVQMAVVSAQHHSAQRCRSIATQTDDFVPSATYAATASPDRCVTDGGIRGSSTRCHLCCTSSCDRVHCASTCNDLLCVQSAVTSCLHHYITDLVHTQFSGTVVGTFAPQVIVSLPPYEEFSAPVYNQVHQEQIAAGETTGNIAEIPLCKKQVLVQEIPHAPQVVDSFFPLEDFSVQPYVPFHESPEVQVAE